MGSFNKLQQFFSSALDLNPDYMKVRLRRAQCYEHEDRLEEALEGDISNHSCSCLVILDTGTNADQTIYSSTAVLPGQVLGCTLYFI